MSKAVGRSLKTSYVNVVIGRSVFIMLKEEAIGRSVLFLCSDIYGKISYIETLLGDLTGKNNALPKIFTENADECFLMFIFSAKVWKITLHRGLRVIKYSVTLHTQLVSD